MPREQFSYSETPPLFTQLEELARQSGVSRGRAFEDWLTALGCALAADTKEDEYLAVVERHKHGEPGRRGADRMARMFAQLVEAMERSDADILGDLYQGSITYGEDGQYFTKDGNSPCPRNEEYRQCRASLPLPSTHRARCQRRVPFHRGDSASARLGTPDVPTNVRQRRAWYAISGHGHMEGPELFSNRSPIAWAAG